MLKPLEVSCGDCDKPLAVIEIEPLANQANWDKIRCLDCQNHAAQSVGLTHCAVCSNPLAQIEMEKDTRQNWFRITCLDCQDKSEGVSITLRDHKTGRTIEKRIALNKSVRALLLVHARDLIPDFVPSNLNKYQVELEKSGTLRILRPRNTLAENDVETNDTLTIIEK
jgi:hypothetical protein